jgi:nitrogenase molybdenum-iron protein alpha/beta subunit
MTAATIAEQYRHLKRLSTIKSGKNIKFFTQAVYPGSYCPMRVGCNIAEDIRGFSYLMVGMPECATYSRSVLSRPEGPEGELHWLYTLSQEEVVFGCRKGVSDALRKMDAAGAKAILIVATCVTDLIGEDLEGLVTELQPEVSARLAFMMVGQFRNFSYHTGAWKAMAAIGRLMRDPPAAPSGFVNAFIVEPWRYANEPVKYPPVVGALERAGARIRRLAPGAAIEDYFAAPDAAVNLCLSSYAQPLLSSMAATWGIPYIPLHSAFTVEDIDRCYKQLEELLGLAILPGFEALRERAIALEERAKRELGGLRYIMLQRVDMPVILADYLAGFGMEPVLMHIEDMHPEDPVYAKRLKERGFDPPVCRFMHIDLDITLVTQLGADLLVGYIPDPIEGVKCVEEMGDYTGTVGYERSASILDRIFTVLEAGKIGERFYGIASF